MKKKSIDLPDPDSLRREAEARLKKARGADHEQTSQDADTLRLLHELQVHQIELEMQNEELHHARAELEELLQLYTDLYDFSPVGYLTLAIDGRIVQINLAASYLLGLDREAIINQRLGSLLEPQFRSNFNHFVEKVFTSGDKESCEVALLQKEGAAPLWVRLEAIIDASNAQQEACRVVMIDISERKQADDLLLKKSTHDDLTGLYNRSFFMAEMARLERGRDFPISIVMIDVDNLKQTNDKYGHTAGDGLLIRVGKILSKAFRRDDVVARIGGDEFVVLLSKTDAKTAKISLERVRQVIQHFNEDPNAIHVQLSIGVSTALDPGPLEPVLNEADKKMYEEKRRNNPQS